jgi:hypothetical protein
MLLKTDFVEVYRTNQKGGESVINSDRIPLLITKYQHKQGYSLEGFYKDRKVMVSII